MLIKILLQTFLRLKRVKEQRRAAADRGCAIFLTKVCETTRKLCNYFEKLQRPCGCAIITISACRQLFRLSLKKSIALGISSSSHISYVYENAKTRLTMQRVWVSSLTFTRLTYDFICTFRIMETRICKCVWRSAGIMALTVVTSTRVFNGNGESLLIKVHTSMEIVRHNWIGNYKRGM